jgi:hypothetical protein
MLFPLYVDVAATGLSILTAQVPPQPPDPTSTGSLSEEIVSENCYVAREPITNEKGQIRLHIEVMCD